MSEVYAAQIENGVVIQVIIGTSEWATPRLGGLWVNSDTLVGTGWAWDETNGFQPPITPEEPME